MNDVLHKIHVLILDEEIVEEMKKKKNVTTRASKFDENY